MISVKPVIVLAAIVAIVSALIIGVREATWEDTSNKLTDKQAAAAVQIYGGTAADYSVVPAENWNGVLGGEFPRITKVIRKNDGSMLYEVVVKGYKDGYDIMVGVADGKCAGVAVVSVGEETPGLGTKTNDPQFLDRFKGISGNAVIVKNTPSSDNEVQAVTSATFSSKGVASAVNIALGAAEKSIDFTAGENAGAAENGGVS